MTATAAVNGAAKIVGGEAAIQSRLSRPLAASSQVGARQFTTASPSTGYASLNDGTVPGQIGVGIGDPAVLSDVSTTAGMASVRLWQGEVHNLPASTVSNDSFTDADLCTPFFIANENTPGKLSNHSGSNRSIGGLVLGLFAGMPVLLTGLVAWLLARAALLLNAKLGAWHTIADAAASTTTAEQAIHREKLHGTITAIQFTGAAVAADNTDYVTVTISKRDGAGGGPVSLGTYDSRAANQGAVTAFTPASFSLSAVAGALDLLETDVVTVTVAKGGAGKVLTGAIRVVQKVI